MANIIPESIRKLLGRFALEMDTGSINENLACALCGKLLMDAYQTYCDCKYCRECITRYLDEGNTHCRGGKDECQEEHLVLGDNVLPNIALNRKVLTVKVRCPNQSCEFSSRLTDMEEHLRVCSQQPIGCPYTSIGCGIGGGSSETVETHLNTSTLVHSELLVEVINNLRNEVGGLKDDFCLSKVEIAALKEELRINYREKILRQEEREELVELMGEQRRQIIELRRKIEYSESDSIMKYDATRMSEVEEDLRVLRKEGESEKAESKKMRCEMEILKKELTKIHESNTRLERENVELRNKMMECSTPLTLQLVGDGQMERRVFLATWKDIPLNNEAHFQLPAKGLTATQCCERLTRANVFTIAMRNVDGQDMLYQSMKLTNGIWVLAELKMKPGDSDYTLSLKSRVIEVYPCVEKFYNTILK